MRRARLLLLASVILGVVIMATQFPLGQLLRGRAAVSEASGQLHHLAAENKSLTGQISLLQQNSTVARIAHADYGLVQKGQRSVVILPTPGSHSTGGGGPLSATTVPGNDIVPSDATVSATPPEAKATKGHSVGFWGRVMQRVEFWRALP